VEVRAIASPGTGTAETMKLILRFACSRHSAFRN